MIEVSRCVVCDGEIRELRQALVSPFLAKRIWNRPPFPVTLAECQACGFIFYNPRLDDDEAMRLYSGYRFAGISTDAPCLRALVYRLNSTQICLTRII